MCDTEGDLEYYGFLVKAEKFNRTNEEKQAHRWREMRLYFVEEIGMMHKLSTPAVLLWNFFGHTVRGQIERAA